MDERGRRNPGHPSRSHSFTTLVTIGAAGTILLLGAGAAYFVTRASPELLATTSRVLVTTGLVGLLVMTCVVAVRWSRPGPDGGGGPGRGQLRPTPVRPAVDPDAELFRILDDARLGDLSARRWARGPERRPGAA
jgi:hypothetical protein